MSREKKLLFLCVQKSSQIMAQHHIDAIVAQRPRNTQRCFAIIVTSSQPSCRRWKCAARCIVEIKRLRVLAAQHMRKEVLGDRGKYPCIRSAAFNHLQNIMLATWQD